MANLFFRTNVAPYRIDTYNVLHSKLNCEFFFLFDYDDSQNFDMLALYQQCDFTPHILKTIKLKGETQLLCTEIGAILKREDPEIVIVPEFKILSVQVLLYKWLHRKSFQVISMCDDSLDMIVNNHEWSRAHKIMRKLLSPRLDNLLLVEDRVADWYRKEYKKGIWLPIIRDERREMARYEMVLPRSEQLAEEFDIVGRKILLYVGRLTPVKNLSVLLHAILKTNEDFVTVFVGSGELEQELKCMAGTIGKPIIFAGHFEGDDVRAWYNIADVFVLPSVMEPYGAVTNEALIAGCRCLVSKKAGSACLIKNGNGSLIDPSDVEGMAKVIDESIRNVTIRTKLMPRPYRMPFTFAETMDRVINEIINKEYGKN